MSRFNSIEQEVRGLLALSWVSDCALPCTCFLSFRAVLPIDYHVNLRSLCSTSLYMHVFGLLIF